MCVWEYCMTDRQADDYLFTLWNTDVWYSKICLQWAPNKYELSLSNLLACYRHQISDTESIYHPKHEYKFWYTLRCFRTINT